MRVWNSSPSRLIFRAVLVTIESAAMTCPLFVSKYLYILSTSVSCQLYLLIHNIYIFPEQTQDFENKSMISKGLVFQAYYPFPLNNQAHGKKWNMKTLLSLFFWDYLVMQM